MNIKDILRNPRLINWSVKLIVVLSIFLCLNEIVAFYMTGFSFGVALIAVLIGFVLVGNSLLLIFAIYFKKTKLLRMAAAAMIGVSIFLLFCLFCMDCYRVAKSFHYIKNYRKGKRTKASVDEEKKTLRAEVDVETGDIDVAGGEEARERVAEVVKSVGQDSDNRKKRSSNFEVTWLNVTLDLISRPKTTIFEETFSIFEISDAANLTQDGEVFQSFAVDRSRREAEESTIEPSGNERNQGKNGKESQEENQEGNRKENKKSENEEEIVEEVNDGNQKNETKSEKGGKRKMSQDDAVMLFSLQASSLFMTLILSTFFRFLCTGLFIHFLFH